MDHWSFGLPLLSYLFASYAIVTPFDPFVTPYVLYLDMFRGRMAFASSLSNWGCDCHILKSSRFLQTKIFLLELKPWVHCHLAFDDSWVRWSVFRVAAGIYCGTLALSLHQVWINSRTSGEPWASIRTTEPQFWSLQSKLFFTRTLCYFSNDCLELCHDNNNIEELTEHFLFHIKSALLKKWQVHLMLPTSIREHFFDKS